MDSNFELDDMSWLTQKDSNKDVANFDILGSSDSDSDEGITVEEQKGNFRKHSNGLVQLEEGESSKSVVLYDNVVAENISSDEEIDAM